MNTDKKCYSYVLYDNTTGFITNRTGDNILLKILEHKNIGNIVLNGVDYTITDFKPKHKYISIVPSKYVYSSFEEAKRECVLDKDAKVSDIIRFIVLPISFIIALVIYMAAVEINPIYWLLMGVFIIIVYKILYALEEFECRYYKRVGRVIKYGGYSQNIEGQEKEELLKELYKLYD